MHAVIVPRRSCSTDCVFCQANKFIHSFILVHEVLMRAFLVYVRPIVEYNLIIWSPSMIHDIDSLESLQRRFTEQLPGVMNLFYYERFKHLNVSIPENCVVSTQICFGVTKLCLVSYI